MPSIAQSLPKLRLVGAAVIKINKGITVNSPSLSMQEIVIGRENLGQTCILCYRLIDSNRALGEEKQSPKLKTTTYYKGSKLPSLKQ